MRQLSAAAFVLLGVPAWAQVPCRNADTIGCDFHPDYGWIVRGSAPARPIPEPARAREPTPATPQPRPLSAQEQAALDGARAADRARAEAEARFRAYVSACKAGNRLGQIECWAAAEDLLAQDMSSELAGKMGQKRWEELRFYNWRPPEFSGQIQRMYAQAEWAERSKADWTKGIAPDPALFQRRLEVHRQAAAEAAQANGGWRPGRLVDSQPGSSGTRCNYQTDDGRSFTLTSTGSCPAMLFDAQGRFRYQR